MKKLLAFGLCVVLLLGISAPAFAAETAAVDYCGVNIVVDGARLCPKDADGKPVEPFIWNGTTYLPVRSVANALGLEVGWEPGAVKLTSGGARTAAIGQPIESTRSRTISIGGQDTKVTLDGRELSLKDAVGNPVTPIISDGVTYLPVRAVADALNVPVLWDGETATVYLGKAIEWKVAKEVCHQKSVGNAETSYTYDAQGRLLTRTESYQDNDGDREVITETYTYDEHGWLLKHTYDQKLTGKYQDAEHYETAYTYDENGKVLTETSASKNSYSDYDYPPRTVTYDFPDGADLSVEKTNDGSIYPYIYFREYDTNGNLTRLSLYSNGWASRQFLYTYDDRGNLLSEPEIFLGNIRSSITYTYDDQNRMLTKDKAATDDFPARHYEYTYDDRGNVSSEQETWMYEEGAWQQVTRYTYDESNNCVKMEEIRGTSSETVYQYNAGNQVIREFHNDTLYVENTYDQYGNLIKTVEPGYDYDNKRYELVANGDDLITTYTYTPIYK